MAIGDPQKVINPGGHAYASKTGVKTALDRVTKEVGKQASGKQLTPKSKLGASKTNLNAKSKGYSGGVKSPKSQPSTYTNKPRGGYDPNKGSMKDKSPQSSNKKKAVKTTGAVKGRSQR